MCYLKHHNQTASLRAEVCLGYLSENEYPPHCCPAQFEFR